MDHNRRVAFLRCTAGWMECGSGWVFGVPPSVVWGNRPATKYVVAAVIPPDCSGTLLKVVDLFERVQFYGEDSDFPVPGLVVLNAEQPIAARFPCGSLDPEYEDIVSYPSKSRINGSWDTSTAKTGLSAVCGTR